MSSQPYANTDVSFLGERVLGHEKYNETGFCYSSNWWVSIFENKTHVPVYI